MKKTATALNSKTILVPLPGSLATIEQFRHGDLLHVATLEQKFAVRLTGTYKVIPSLMKCMVTKGREVEGSFTIK